MLAIAKTDHEIHDDRAQRIDAVVPRVLDHPTAGTHVRIVGESVEWRGCCATQRRSPRLIPPCSLPANRAPARRSSRGSSMPRLRAGTGRSSR